MAILVGRSVGPIGQKRNIFCSLSVPCIYIYLNQYYFHYNTKQKVKKKKILKVKNIRERLT